MTDVNQKRRRTYSTSSEFEKKREEEEKGDRQILPFFLPSLSPVLVVDVYLKSIERRHPSTRPKDQLNFISILQL